jgi:ribosomal protein L11 methyltransferase
LALRLSIAGAGAEMEERLFDVLAGVPSSWTRDGSGLVVWVEERDAEDARVALLGSGVAFEAAPEPERDWVAEAAALQRPVEVGRYLLDPHDGARAAAAGDRTRLFVPATRAFGTGSHESTRLALRLLLAERVAGRSVLDVGTGVGTLALVAAREGARRVVGFDVDPDAAFATRELARANATPGIAAFVGPLEALRPAARFDVAVANLIHEELAPLLPALRGLLAPAGVLLAAGQLAGRRGEWHGALEANGFSPESETLENDWIGTRARLR